jgi:alanyl-tRNA synthetase
MEVSKLREKFLQYFESKSYKKLPAASLIPENDPSVLFTTAGMQQFKPYYTHPNEAPALKVTTSQPSIRTTDIAEVGDDTHLTMFEMLGLFTFGRDDSYELKKEAITAMWEFVSETLVVDKDRVFVTVFSGDDETPKDDESARVWTELGVEIKEMGREDNFWGPTGEEGPCGPNTEIYVDGIEVGNLVFNEYYRDRYGKFEKLSLFGLDYGGGLERLSTILQGKNSVWHIEPFKSWVELIDSDHDYESRVIIDHLRAAIFMISEGIQPANKGRDYVLRRLIRKAVFLSRKVDASVNWKQVIDSIRVFYAKEYMLFGTEEILLVFYKEKDQFEKNLSKATNHLERWLEQNHQRDEKKITELAFYLYESFGFPKELLLEYLVSQGWSVDMNHFAELFKQHQEVSRSGSEKQFKGGLADHNEKTIKHHTAHHLLLAALRKVLGPTVFQKGSNVTSDRLRIDFSFDRKLTTEELSQVESLVNEKINEDLPIIKEQLAKEKALQSGALAEFGQKYGDVVTVYSIGDFSKELCGGPHVSHTGELGHFSIIKEEASSQGVRRIKAIIK